MAGIKSESGVWRKLIDLFRGQKFWMDGIADAFGVTPLMAQALMELPAAETITMKELAGLLWCDASNATGLVDRLETSGFVERRPSAHDRRMKCVALTPAGRRLRRKITDRMNEAPPAIAALSLADQAALEAIIDRALAKVHETRTEPGPAPAVPTRLSRRPTARASTRAKP